MDLLIYDCSADAIKKFLRNGADYYFNGFFRLEKFTDAIQNVVKQFRYNSIGYAGFLRVN